MRLSALVLSASLLGLSASSGWAAPKVVASIVPVHSLVTSVMDGVGTPELLLSGQTSEHQASYTPEQIKMLGDADLVFIIGQGLELKLDDISGSEAVKGKRFVELSGLSDLRKLPVREGGAFEPHEHENGTAAADGEDHDHAHGTATFDPHLWLDPGNAKVMAAAISAALSKADPAHAAQYAANAAALGAEIDALAAELAADLSGVKDRPFVVTHDAFQYFERAFGLTAAGSISDFTGTAPSAQRLREIRERLKAVGAVCVFREPQFSDKAAMTVIEGSAARDGVLDPIGATLSPGRDAYATLLRNLARDFKACLAG